jgi:hypothetical protein
MEDALIARTAAALRAASASAAGAGVSAALDAVAAAAAATIAAPAPVAPPSRRRFTPPVLLARVSAAVEVRTTRYCSPRHILPSDSINEGLK